MRERFKRRTLDIILVVALLTIVLQRTLRNVSEVFPGGAAIGEILATLATGYVGAWFFNLLNIRLPANRAKRAVISRVGNVVAQYAGQSRAILQEMANKAGLPEVPHSPDRKILHAILSRTRGTDASNAIYFDGSPSAPMNWLQYMHMTVRDKRSSLDRLGTAYDHFEPETVAAISAVDSTTIVRIVERYPEFPPANHNDLTWLEDMYMDFWAACSDLEQRYTVEIRPLVPERQRITFVISDSNNSEWACFTEDPTIGSSNK